MTCSTRNICAMGLPDERDLLGGGGDFKRPPGSRLPEGAGQIVAHESEQSKATMTVKEMCRVTTLESDLSPSMTDAIKALVREETAVSCAALSKNFQLMSSNVEYLTQKLTIVSKHVDGWFQDFNVPLGTVRNTVSQHDSKLVELEKMLQELTYLQGVLASKMASEHEMIAQRIRELKDLTTSTTLRTAANAGGTSHDTITSHVVESKNASKSETNQERGPATQVSQSLAPFHGDEPPADRDGAMLSQEMTMSEYHHDTDDINTVAAVADDPELEKSLCHITLHKTLEVSRLGISHAPADGGATLLLGEVKSGGLIHQWNRENPHKTVGPGDKIVTCNGVRSDAGAIFNAILAGTILELSIHLQDASQHDSDHSMQDRARSELSTA